MKEIFFNCVQRRRKRKKKIGNEVADIFLIFFKNKVIQCFVCLNPVLSTTGYYPSHKTVLYTINFNKILWKISNFRYYTWSILWKNIFFFWNLIGILPLLLSRDMWQVQEFALPENYFQNISCEIHLHLLLQPLLSKILPLINSVQIQFLSFFFFFVSLFVNPTYSKCSKYSVN